MKIYENIISKYYENMSLLESFVRYDPDALTTKSLRLSIFFPIIKKIGKIDELRMMRCRLKENPVFFFSHCTKNEVFHLRISSVGFGHFY